MILVVNVGLSGNPVLTVSEGKGIRGIPTSTPGGVLGPANGTASERMGGLGVALLEL